MLVATLAQALVAGLVLIVAPLAVLRRGRRRAGSRSGLARVAAYFLCLGLAFLFVEIAFIQRFTLFLAHPLYAVAVVLAAFLVFAGAGSAASGWLERGLERRLAGRGGGSGRGAVSAISAAAGAVVVLSVAYTLALPPLFARAMALPQVAKLAAVHLGFTAVVLAAAALYALAAWVVRGV